MWRSRHARFVLLLIGAGCLWIGLMGWASRHFGGERLLISRGEVDMGVLPPNSQWIGGSITIQLEERTCSTSGCLIP